MRFNSVAGALNHINHINHADNQRNESIDAQLGALREYAQRNNIIIIGEYIDRAKSAMTDNHPQFLQIIKFSAKKYLLRPKTKSPFYAGFLTQEQKIHTGVVEAGRDPLSMKTKNPRYIGSISTIIFCTTRFAGRFCSRMSAIQKS